MPLPFRKAVRCTLSVALIVAAAIVPALPAAADPGFADDAKLDQRLFVEPGPQSVMIHVADAAPLGEVVEAATALGLDVGSRFATIDVFRAVGSKAELQAVATLPQIDYIEAEAPVEFFTESSHHATRGQEVLDGAVTMPDGSRIDGAGVGVAVVDSGVDGTHPDLASRMGGNVKIVCPSSTRGVGVTGFPFEGCRTPHVAVPMDDTDTPSAGGHGTHVAGIIAGDGTGSEGRYHGAAPGATLYGVSSGDFLTTGDVVDGMNWVLENNDVVSPAIRVVNNSWGTQYAEYRVNNTFHTAIWDMQEALVEDGVVVVQAAGNAGGGEGFGATTTAECINPTPGIICVANYRDNDTGRRDQSIDGSSSRGRWDDPRSWPDLAAPGTHITATCRAHLPICAALNEAEDGGDNYATLTGTSMAAPHVAGIVAQVLQANPALEPAEVENLLEDTAHKFEWNSAYGLFPDPTNPDNSSSFEKGHGLVDVVAATRVALGLDPAPGPSTFPPGEPDLPEARAAGFIAQWDFISITEQEFASTCLMLNSGDTPIGRFDITPATQGIDAYVFTVPDDVRDLPLESRIGASNPIGFFDLTGAYYDSACEPLGTVAATEVRHAVPEAAQYVVVTPGIFGYATNVYAEWYDTTPVVVEPEATTLALTIEGKGSARVLVATLADSAGTGVAGRTIDFFANGASIGSSVTSSGGRAELAVPSSHRSSKARFSASFAGDEAYSPSSSN